MYMYVKYFTEICPIRENWHISQLEVHEFNFLNGSKRNKYHLCRSITPDSRISPLFATIYSLMYAPFFLLIVELHGDFVMLYELCLHVIFIL